VATREHTKGDSKKLATIEFKNQETQQFFKSLIEEEQTETKKIQRMLYLVKSGLVWESV
jgi:hypothetical protein